MSEPLTAAEEERYTSIIDSILETSNLETVSTKKIRSGLQKALGDKDISHQKNAIKQLIGARFDAITSASGTMPTPPSLPLPNDDVQPSPKRDRSEMTNGYEEEEVDEEAVAEGDEDEIEVSLGPAKKKQKRESSLDDDAKLAAQLQAEENQRARSRTTRGSNGAGGGSGKARKKAPKKKSSNKVKAEDDSDVDGSGAEGRPTKRKAGGGFQKPFNLSHNLALLCGESVLPRPQVVKKLWEHIKSNNLQDPNDKRQIICDDMMQAVFKQSKVDMFQMNKLIGNHLYPVDEE